MLTKAYKPKKRNQKKKYRAKPRPKVDNNRPETTWNCHQLDDQQITMVSSYNTFTYSLILLVFLILGPFSVNCYENIHFIPFERNENTGVSLTLAGEHALENGFLQKRNKKDLPIFDSIFSPEVFESENNQHPFDEDTNECGGLYRNFSTLLLTPNFGIKNYEPGLNCEYIIFSPYRCPNEFHIQFLDFEIEYSENCTKDYLEIGIEPRICGQIVGIKNYKTEDGVLVINFQSDGTIEGKGFKLLVTRQPCNEDYTIRKLRQNNFQILNDNRNGKSLNVKGIANHLLPPEKTKSNVEGSNNILSTSDNNYNFKFQEEKAQKYINQKNVPESISNYNNNNIDYSNPHINPVSSLYSNHVAPFPNNNPLVPPKNNRNEYLPPPANYPQPQIDNSIAIDKPISTVISGTDDAKINLPNYPRCHSYPNQIYETKPQFPALNEIPNSILTQNPVVCCHSPTLPIVTLGSYNSKTPNFFQMTTIPWYPPINSNYQTQNQRNNIPLIVNSNRYPENANELPLKTIQNQIGTIRSQSQILGIIPSGTLPPCCANIFTQQRFYLSSPGFPYSSNYFTDCLYYIRKNSQNICRLRINLKFFVLGNTATYNYYRQLNNIAPEICLDDFIEIDGQRICGCKTGIEYISEWGLEDKIIRLKLFGKANNSQKNGFILDILQEECSNRFRKNIVNDGQPQILRRDLLIHSSDNNNLNSKNTSSHETDKLENLSRTNFRIKRQISFDNPTGSSSQFFAFQNKQNQCSFTAADFFKLIIELPWINRPQCIGVGQAIVQV
ncbi:uncharacterized protein LOC129608441 [Condylostylus longicornis]|uniref:uncharacterized protein LOC129608441 n=1 Tax=Condylostylus longicornis TaxID=2530218 RepID=UPI00244DA89A|nr:uncharacterized protein LOC129608441 [Condylostylus longicornis]